MLIMKVVAIYVFVNFLLYCSCVPLEEFYPFGPSAGDSQLQITDDGNSPAVKLLIPFRFFNQQHDSLFVSSYLYNDILNMIFWVIETTYLNFEKRSEKRNFYHFSVQNGGIKVVSSGIAEKPVEYCYTKR